MYSTFQLAKKYLQYWLAASNGKGHGTHSPFVYEFIVQVLNDSRQFYCYKTIEGLRHRLMTDSTVLHVEDYGAGSVVSKTKNRAVKEIANTALKPAKFGQLMFRIANYYNSKNIVELGTSLGITTAYLASAAGDARVTTMEGAPAIAALALRNFNELALKNIGLVQGNFDETLAPALKSFSIVDLAFVDGNHRREPTLHYFEQLLQYSHEYTILIFDDVHWSSEMEAAWETIKADSRVRLTIDLFFIGLVFFRKDFKEKQDFVVRF
ncbi:MAG: class I SAM-dependent methyltransferase [Chitinophagaceae bacterium]